MAKTEGKVVNKTLNDTPTNAKQVSIAVLEALLIDTIDATNITRQAHWNVKGSHFIGLHTLFEKFYNELFEAADELAERAVQLGAVVNGTSQNVAGKSRLTPYDPTILDGVEHCRALAKTYAELAKSLREGIDATDEAGDADTADLITGQSRAVDKALWMIEAHLQGK